MSQPINIRVLETGERIDVYAAETIELNMGGISLLNLADRPTSYTNSFNLPRTPNNEQIFEFASQPTRRNRPSIKVIITKGLFQKFATLKLKDFDSDYKCEVSYDSDGVIEKIKNQGLDLFDDYCDIVFLSTATLYPEGVMSELYEYAEFNGLDPSSYDKEQDGAYCYPIQTNTLTVSRDGGIDPITNLPVILERNIFSSLQVVLKMGAAKLGLTIDGDLFTSDISFSKAHIQNNNYTIYAEGRDDTPIVELYISIHKNTDVNIKQVYLSDLIKSVATIWGCDVSIVGNNISINKVSSKLLQEGTNTETLSFTKSFSTGYSKLNRILYKAKDAEKKYFGSDIITAEGAGEKDILTINSIIPKTDSIGYISDLENTNGEIFIVVTDAAIAGGAGKLYVVAPTYLDDFYYEVPVDYFNASILSMSGFYSSFLNPIFTDPVLLNVDGYIDPFTANTIMANRVINSIKLGGRYWVDEMKYNLTTGNTTLKLIKL